MIGFKQLIATFFGKRPVEFLARANISLKEGIINFAVPFFFVSILLSMEVLFVNLALSLVNSQEIVSLLIGMIILAIGLAILVPIVFMCEIIFYYIFGASQFLVAGIFRKEKGSLNDFLGSFLTMFASVKLICGIVLLVPLLGWLVAILSKIYSIILNYRFVRERFNLTDAQAAIVVLVPVDILIGLLLVVVTAIAFFLIGSRVL